jgi:hypothetical protein
LVQEVILFDDSEKNTFIGVLFLNIDYHIWVRHHVVAHISDMRDRYIPFFPSEKIFIKVNEE